MNSTNISTDTSPNGYITWDGYIRGTVDLVGIFTNTICILLFFSSTKLKHTSYKFMTAKSISNLVYFIIAFETEILTFCVNCGWSSSYLAAFNYCYIYIFFSGCLYFYTITIDVVLSVYTYSILVNKSWPGKYTYLVICVTLFFVSIAFYGQKPLVFMVQQVPNTDRYYYTYSSFALSWTNKTLQIAQSFIKIILSVIVVSLVNIINVVTFTRRFKKRVFTTTQIGNNGPINVTATMTKSKSKTTDSRQNEGNSNRSNSDERNQHNVVMTKNITRMVIASLFVNSLCQIPYSVVFTANYLGVYNDVYKMAASIANILVLIPLAIEFFVYYLFNRLFRRVFNDYVRRFLPLSDFDGDDN